MKIHLRAYMIFLISIFVNQNFKQFWSEISKDFIELKPFLLDNYLGAKKGPYLGCFISLFKYDKSYFNNVMFLKKSPQPFGLFYTLRSQINYQTLTIVTTI